MYETGVAALLNGRGDEDEEREAHEQWSHVTKLFVMQ